MKDDKDKRFTDEEWNRLMWATSHVEVERIYKEAYDRRVAEGGPREGFDRLREVENELISQGRRHRSEWCFAPYDGRYTLPEPNGTDYEVSSKDETLKYYTP